MASTKTKQTLLSIFGNVAKAAVASGGKKKPQQTGDDGARLAGLRSREKKPCGACGGKK